MSTSEFQLCSRGWGGGYSSKNYRTGLHMQRNFWVLPEISYLILSMCKIPVNSLSQASNLGGVSDFHYLKMHHFAMTMPYAIIVLLLRPIALIVLGIQKRAVSGSGSRFSLRTWEYHLKIEYQKVCISRHNQNWWSSVLSDFLHLSHSGEDWGKILWVMTFESCSLCMTLNWISCNLALTEQKWISFRACFHKSSWSWCEDQPPTFAEL